MKEPSRGALEAHDSGLFLGGSAQALAMQRRAGEMIGSNWGSDMLVIFAGEMYFILTSLRSKATLWRATTPVIGPAAFATRWIW